MEHLIGIAENFGINDLQNFRRIVKGKINETYLVENEKSKFIVQKIKTRQVDASDAERNFFIASERTKNYNAVYEALKGSGLESPRPLPLVKRSGNIFRSSDGSLWRAFNYIIHDDEAPTGAWPALESGMALGLFHRHLGQNKFRPNFPIPGFHDTQKVLETLGVSAKEKGQQKLAAVLPEYRFLLTRTPRYFLPKGLPKTLIHADPKMDNFLFHNQSVKAVIDLDNMMEGSVYLDIGDALRSWCRVDKQFSEEIFFSAVLTYQAHSAIKLDFDLALRAVRLITLELAARYLTDYFREDYFAWDNSRFESAAEHNLVRAREMLAYYESMRLFKPTNGA